MRLRVQSCIDTIIDLNDRLGDGKIEPEIIKQFERLKDYLTDDNINEKDINRIEEATNQLLEKIRTAYGEDVIISIHEGPIH